MADDATVMTRGAVDAPKSGALAGADQAATGPIERRKLRPDEMAIRMFAGALTVLNIAGHAFLGFEQAWITPFVAVGVCVGLDLLGRTLDNRVGLPELFRRAGAASEPRFGALSLILPAWITGLAVGMLLYAAHQMAAVVFACVVAIGSKYVFRIGKDHFLNPSNFGIAVALLLFPSVGIAPPYMFTENIYGAADFILPLIIVGTGSVVNTKLTGRHRLIIAWLLGFLGQAVIRSLINGTPWTASVGTMTGFAFILFTFYMITDPKTTPGPEAPMRQYAFGVAVAAAYGVLTELHVVFGLFFALALVTGARGLWIFAVQRWRAMAGRVPTAAQA